MRNLFRVLNKTDAPTHCPACGHDLSEPVRDEAADFRMPVGPPNGGWRLPTAGQVSDGVPYKPDRVGERFSAPVAAVLRVEPEEDDDK